MVDLQEDTFTLVVNKKKIQKQKKKLELLHQKELEYKQKQVRKQESLIKAKIFISQFLTTLPHFFQGPSIQQIFYWETNKSIVSIYKINSYYVLLQMNPDDTIVQEIFEKQVTVGYSIKDLRVVNKYSHSDLKLKFNEFISPTRVF
jgi:hypothetical protein